MYLTKFSPRKDFRGANSLFNNFLEDPFFNGPTQKDVAKTENWNLKVDIYNKDDSFVLKAELPGVDKKNIKVDVNERVLSIKGERKTENEENEKSCYRREMFYGKFERSFTIPAEVDVEQIKADFKDGILTLTIPKPEERKPKEITIH